MTSREQTDSLIDARLLHAMLDGFLCADDQGVILEANPAYCEAVGYSRDELVGMRVQQLEHVEEAAVRARIKHMMASGTSRFETVHVAKSGREVEFEVSASVSVIDGRGRVSAFLRDITQRKAAEQRLSNSSKLLEKIQPLAHLGIWEWDIRSNTVTWSDELYRTYGISRDEFGASFEGYLARVHPDDRVRILGAVQHALESSSFSFKERVVRPSGEVRSLESWGGVVRNDVGEPLTMFGACLDVTESVRAQAALQEANEVLEARVRMRTAELAEAKERAESSDQLKSNFLATMSHELRTPLNSIIGFTGVLLKGLAGPLNAEQEKQLGMVRDSGQHLLALINDVLDLSKIEAQALTLRREPFSLSSSMQRVFEGLRVSAESQGLALHRMAPDHPIELNADRRRIEQVLFNLVSNAIKFTPKGSVRLSCAAKNGFIEVSVQDTGIGIAAADLPKIFQPFHQVDGGLTRLREGTGLGLSISQHLARMHGGEIRVQSELGVGSTFTLVLPLA